MKIGNVRYRNKNYLARQVKDEILLYSSIPSQNSGIIFPGSTDKAIASSQVREAITSGEISHDTTVTKELELEFLPCVLHPEKIVGVGFNYRQHADETKTGIQGNPVLFSKFSDAVTGHRQRVKIPGTVHSLDYEAELAIVVGKRAFHVKQEEARNYIFGYCPANDLSARDLQMLTSQFLLGKTLPGFAPTRTIHLNFRRNAGPRPP
ncbi:5-carboxymethyl-2-hydroxymuconate Delta-isomerase [mine drainage metagenome]|uniref:5-carboxymethyl-2-hydroxymuconate Delta-isomerase n=1 Tax=mine drainage metagenome TaxID=410659 RepID=T0ZT12_9ZZZZ